MAFLKEQTSPLAVANILHSQLKLSEKKALPHSRQLLKDNQSPLCLYFPSAEWGLKKKKKKISLHSRAPQRMNRHLPHTSGLGCRHR